MVKAAVDEKDGGCEVGAIIRGGGGITMEYQRRWGREKVGENKVEGGGKKVKEMGWSLCGRGLGAARTRWSSEEWSRRLEEWIGRSWKGDGDGHEWESWGCQKEAFQTAKIHKNEKRAGKEGEYK